MLSYIYHKSDYNIIIRNNTFYIERKISMSDNLNNTDETISNTADPSPDGYYSGDSSSYRTTASPYAGEYNAPRYPDSGSYAYVSENSSAKSSKKRHPVLRTTAFILCLAIVGVGSVQGYRIYQDHHDKNGFSEYKNSSESNSSSTIKAENSDAPDEPLPSMIELAAREDAKSIPDIVDSIMPSVVGVSATFEYTANYYDFFGWGMGSSSPQEMVGRGTGIIFSEDGYIVTNAHCVYDDSSSYQAGEALEVSVRFSDETEHNAKIIAYDTDTDIAVLKVNETGLTPAVFGDSDDLRVGELVIAVGNPLGFDLFGSVTSGIVSALNRQISVNDKQMSLIQTDAAINSGNSGGPLLNSCGQVIGINSAKMSSSYGSASVEGLGFAIPISDAKSIIDDLIHYNYVKGRPQLGISTVDITESDSRRYNMPMGAYIVNVVSGSAADEAGLMIRDIIIDINGDTISSTSQLNAVKNKYKAGDTVTVTVNRNGKDMQLEVTLQEDVSNMAGGQSGAESFNPSN